jgi:hypothetical protein
VYDRNLGTFFVIASGEAENDSPDSIFVAEAQNAKGRWCTWQIKTGLDSVDYPQVGYSHNALFMTMNTSAGAPRLYGIPLFKLRGAQSLSQSVRQITGSEQLANPLSGDSQPDIVPGQMFDTVGSALSNGYLYAAAGRVVGRSAIGYISQYVIHCCDHLYVVGGGPRKIAVDDYVGPPQYAPQASTSVPGIRLDFAGSGLTQVQIANGYAWTANTVLANGRSAVDVYKIKLDFASCGSSCPEWNVTSTAFLYMPAIGVSYANGNTLLAYNVSSATLVPRIAYRNGPDFHQAGAPIEWEVASNTERWGDFSTTSLDPVTSQVWVMSQFAHGGSQGNGDWSTWLAAVGLPH